MEVALIPPRGLERWILKTNRQMMLPHIGHPEYEAYYSMAQLRGHAIMLDNGAAEFSQKYTAKQLCVMAQRLGASELVMTDHLRMAKKTVNAVRWFVSVLETLTAEQLHGLSFMAVAQGKTVEEAKYCISAFSEVPLVTILGIPRLLVSADCKPIRIDLANWTEDNFPNRFQIHLLGTSPAWPREVERAARYAPHIRSVDTSMPFNYAIAGERLDVKDPPSVSRHARYFIDSWSRVSQALLTRNVDTLLGWANAEASTSQL